MSGSRVCESRVFSKGIEDVWKYVRPAKLAFWSPVKSVEVEGSVDAVGSLRKITYNDGTVEKHRILELSDLNHFITWEVFESNPPAKVLGAIHSLKLREVTHDGSTFVEFASEFSAGEGTLAVVEDAKYKKREAFADLAKALGV